MSSAALLYRRSQPAVGEVDREVVDVFGTRQYVGRPRVVEWSDLVAHVDDDLRELDADPYASMRNEGVSVQVADLARTALRAGRDDLARALFERALRAPHDSLPTANATPLERLIGDIALAALRANLRRFSRDAQFTRASLRLALSEVAAITGTEAAQRASELVAVLDDMRIIEERASEAERETGVIALWDQPYLLEAQLRTASLTEAMAKILPLLDSPHLTRQTDHRAMETDLSRLSHLVIEMAQSIAGREFSSGDEVRAWWEDVRADGGIAESIRTIEANLRVAHPNYRTQTHLVRVARADPARAVTLLRRWLRQASSGFRQLFLQALTVIDTLDEAFVRQVVLDGLQSQDTMEVSTAIQAAIYRDPPVDEAVDRLVRMLPDLLDAQGDMQEDLVHTVTGVLLERGHADVVTRVWSRLGHRLRSYAVQQVPLDLEPAVMSAVLHDEGTLLLSAPEPGCATLLAADHYAARLQVQAGGVLDCDAPPEVRRSLRERLAATPTPQPRPIETVRGEGITVFVDGPTALTASIRASALAAPADLHALLTAGVRALSGSPALLIAAFRRRDTGIEVELHARSTDSGVGGLMIQAYTRTGDQIESIQETSTPISPGNALFLGAAPFVWLSPAFESLSATGGNDAVYTEMRW